MALKEQKPYTNWSVYIGALTRDVTDHPAVIDERIHAYKGVHNRMGLGNINDKFHHLGEKDTVFGDDAVFD